MRESHQPKNGSESGNWPFSLSEAGVPWSEGHTDAKYWLNNSKLSLVAMVIVSGTFLCFDFIFRTDQKRFGFDFKFVGNESLRRSPQRSEGLWRYQSKTGQGIRAMRRARWNKWVGTGQNEFSRQGLKMKKGKALRVPWRGLYSLDLGYWLQFYSYWVNKIVTTWGYEQKSRH